jgi:quinol monooxygenase YgiN
MREGTRSMGVFLLFEGRKMSRAANQVQNRGAVMIIVMGYVHLNPSDVDEFLADIQVIAPGTRAEKGCLFYAVTLDDASAGRMLVAERWRNQASLTAHLKGAQAAAFQKWDNRIKIDVLRYDASNEGPLFD